jgi:UDP-sulfoquinovose synthase
VQDTFNCYEACKYWWLRSFDIMQGVIFGVHTDQVARDNRLRTRLDIDECFGTVINRFVAQAVTGIPLTLYGQGKQIRGYIALRDAMQCMTRLINAPPEPGQYAAVNQVSGIYSVRHLACKVRKIGRNTFGLPIQIQRVENPASKPTSIRSRCCTKNCPSNSGSSRRSISTRKSSGCSSCF